MDWFLYDNGLRHKRVNIIITVLECSRSLHCTYARTLVPRCRAIVSIKIQTKRLKLYLLTHLYVKH